MNRKQRLHRFNRFVQLGCALVFAIGGTLAGLAVYALSGNPMVEPLTPVIGLVLSGGLFAAAACAAIGVEV